MPSYSKNDVILVRYPFSDLSSSKVRPAVIVSVPHISQDIFIVPSNYILTHKAIAPMRVLPHRDCKGRTFHAMSKNTTRKCDRH